MRGLLVVNPRATTTSTRVTDVIVNALSNELDLQVTMTTHRGHGFELGRSARAQGLDIVITLGGDGVVNEVVNGMLEDGVGADVPILATVPGGSGNVFARALGIPVDAVEATGEIMEAMREQRTRTIGLGKVNGRWFTSNAGVGLDAEIISAMEEQRSAGRTASPTRYLMTTLRQYFARTDRRNPALTLTTADGTDEGVFLAIVQNTAPWTYFGSWPIDPCPQASFDTGLDVFALRKLRVISAMRAARRMLAHSTAGSTKDSILVRHDLGAFTIVCGRPMPMQVDGESTPEVTTAEFESVPAALRVIAVQ
ncbi:MAG: diacylglycerol/lipid kinase family protein [Candidatus Nanopelagicales bacterium]